MLVTVLGYVLDGRPSLQHRIVDSALGQFPVIGPELEQHSLKGSGLALAVGIAVSLWTGTSVFLAAENAMNRIWGVPADELPGLVSSRLRALGLLGVLGAGLLATAVLTGIGANGGSLGIALRAGTVIGSLAANFFLFWLAFRLLTLGSVETRTLRVGAAAAAAGYQVLQLIGSYYVGRTLTNASNVYGTFASRDRPALLDLPDRDDRARRSGDQRGRSATALARAAKRLAGLGVLRREQHRWDILLGRVDAAHDHVDDGDYECRDRDGQEHVEPAE